MGDVLRPAGKQHKRILCYVPLFLILLGIGTLVVPAPWRVPASNDEMLHLKSWRNRYGTDDVFPVGRHKIAKARNIPEGIRRAALAVYDSGPIGQRLFIVLQDCHPSLWPITAEIIAALTNSSLVAIRAISLLSFIIVLFFLYRIGVRLAGPSQGLLLVTLWSVSYLALEYAGMARMYAPAMAALTFFLHEYLKSDVTNDRDFRNLSLLAILPISLEWFVWPAVYMLLALAIVRRVRQQRSLHGILRRHLSLLPFLVVCAGFMGYYLVLRNFHPSLDPEYSRSMGYHPPYEHLVAFLAKIGPASFLASLGEVITPYVASANAAFYALGAWFFARTKRIPGDFRLFVIGLAVAAFCLPLAIRMLERHYMLATFVPIVFFSLAMVDRIPGNWRRWMAIGILLAGNGLLYSQERFFGKDNVAYDHPHVARTVQAALGSDGNWIAFPYQRAMCIYRYADLPDPKLPTSRDEFESELQRLQAGEEWVVLTRKSTVRGLNEKNRGLFRRSKLVAEFPGGDVVYKIKP